MPLDKVLKSFKEEANNNSNLPKILKNWNPNIIVDSEDDDITYTILVRDQCIESIVEKNQEQDHVITIHADSDILEQVFSGKANPSEMVLEGQLQVFGSESDQIKLDAITLILWGM